MSKLEVKGFVPCQSVGSDASETTEPAAAVLQQHVNQNDFAKQIYFAREITRLSYHIQEKLLCNFVFLPQQCGVHNYKVQFHDLHI